MPQLKWDETDFIECLETIPQIEEYATEHFFEVQKNGLKLHVTVWQYESVAFLELYRDELEKPITGFALFIRGNVKLVKERSQESLHFHDCFLAPSRFSYLDYETNLHDTNKVPYGFDVHLMIKPHIRINFLRSG